MHFENISSSTTRDFSPRVYGSALWLSCSDAESWCTERKNKSAFSNLLQKFIHLPLEGTKKAFLGGEKVLKMTKFHIWNSDWIKICRQCMFSLNLRRKIKIFTPAQIICSLFSPSLFLAKKKKKKVFKCEGNRNINGSWKFTQNCWS